MEVNLLTGKLFTSKLFTSKLKNILSCFIYISVLINHNTKCMKIIDPIKTNNKMTLLVKKENKEQKEKRHCSFLTSSKMNLFEKNNSPKNSTNKKTYKIPELLITGLANNTQEFNCDFYDNNTPSTPNSQNNYNRSLKTQEFQELIKKEPQSNEKTKNNNRLINLDQKDISGNKNGITRKKSFRDLLKKIDIEYKVHKTVDNQKANKKILGVNGTIFFCDIRNFTFFCNQCPKDEMPAMFMSEYSDAAEKIFNHWNAHLTSTAGDSFVVIFPKKRSEINNKESFINAFLCSIEFVIKMSKLIKTKKQEYFPKKFDLGLETGMTYFYKLNKSKNIVPIAVVSKTINNAQRYEAHSKQSQKRKITISEKTYNLLNSHKKIQKLFTLKSLLEAKGIEGRPFVYSCSLKDIKDFYESNDWEKYKKQIFERNAESTTENNLNTILSIL
jgi:class 3 adenylate cyclase